jgi:transcriptional regulator with XRE-family HTH domain
MKHGTLGQRLLALRKYKNLSLAELAEMINISSSNINRYERDMSRPTTEYIKKLCEFYHVSADYLLFGVPTKEFTEAGFWINDPKLKEMVSRLTNFMESDEPHIRSWAIVQFERAFPKDKG